MWMKPDKEMGKSSELRTRFIRPSRYFISVEWETLGFKEWKKKIRAHTHNHPELSVRFPHVLAVHTVLHTQGPRSCRSPVKTLNEACPFTSAVWPCFPGEVIHRCSKQGNTIKNFFINAVVWVYQKLIYSYLLCQFQEITWVFQLPV